MTVVKNLGQLTGKIIKSYTFFTQNFNFINFKLQKPMLSAKGKNRHMNVNDWQVYFCGG